jgi:integrase
VRSRIERDIKPHLGSLAVEDVKPLHIDALLQAIVARGAPTTANDVLRWVKRMFDYAVKRHLVEQNPAAAFDLADAGGTEKPRERALSLDELGRLFVAMELVEGISRENELTVKLLLLLGVRKMELCVARWDEFTLDVPVPLWRLPGSRTKTGIAIDIPLPPLAVAWLVELKRLACSSAWVLPARKMQNRMLPHVAESTIGVALAKVNRGLPPFTVHDFRRYARTHLAALNIPRHVAESCLNYKIGGIEGVYNRHDYFEERRAALNAWANLLAQVEHGETTVRPIKAVKFDSAYILSRK